LINKIGFLLLTLAYLRIDGIIELAQSVIRVLGIIKKITSPSASFGLVICFHVSQMDRNELKSINNSLFKLIYT